MFAYLDRSYRSTVRLGIVLSALGLVEIRRSEFQPPILAGGLLPS
jgi:hypothetical protein